jgi:hypothetical protein
MTSRGESATCHRTVRIVQPEQGTALADRVVAILTRHLRERCGAGVMVEDHPAPLTIELTLDGGIGTEGFAISDVRDGTVRISGGGEKGLLYGVGKFLHTSRFEDGGLVPSQWRGVSVPEKAIRGIYFWPENGYAHLPATRVVEYIEDLALWGCNTFGTWWHLATEDRLPGLQVDSPRGREQAERFRLFWSEAKALGMRTWLCMAPLPCPYGSDLTERILPWFEEVCRHFSDIEIDYLVTGGYDPGGCKCDRCAPWGANGFVRVTQTMGEVFMRHWPRGKVILSTWYFSEAEWMALAQAWNHGAPDWVAYLMAGTSISHRDVDGGWFPVYPLRNGVPGNLPMLDFPEISMLDGGRPDPDHLTGIWRMMGDRVEGGFPYSEGMRTDLNSVMCLQFYWNGRDGAETAREYAAFEFSPDVADEVVGVIRDMAQCKPNRVVPAYGGWMTPTDGPKGLTPQVLEPDATYMPKVESICDRIERIEARLPLRAMEGWRWRLMYHFLAPLLEGAAPNRVAAQINRMPDIHDGNCAGPWPIAGFFK